MKTDKHGLKIKMNKNDFPEIGYTPANLRYLLTVAGLTQAAGGALTNASLRAVQGWLADKKSPSARDMPCAKWQELLGKVQELLAKTQYTEK